MVKFLLPIAILAGLTVSAPPPPPLFSIYEGSCNALGKGLGSYSFNPHPAKRTDSGCLSIPKGTGTVMKFENAPTEKFPCTAYVFNNGNCDGKYNGVIDGVEYFDVRCRDGYGICSYELVCHGR
ncbi:hypothetical protein EJ03DRAFT_147991 [Teratosphaeria nubilosa]|uniref:Cyanovirin-N domain-containing protein n=1 Tax=Teratosphaeria nubilosa TaxID=161662 RepID=A0A6G1L3M4_9PEZI|nr:hypothetical protein EJ03DRAFT_147991 [Teratosphaeria nubilosa]